MTKILYILKVSIWKTCPLY